MNENGKRTSVLSHGSIKKRASDRWNKKTDKERIHDGLKYKHIFDRYNLQAANWSNMFENLSSHQKNILIKGELIRTYDALSNEDKTQIKQKFGLSHFSSKWFRLSPKDKKTLLVSILHN